MLARSGAPDCDLFISYDLRSRLDPSLISRVVDHFGQIDILVNNAGSQAGALDDHLALMLHAPYRLSMYAKEYMQSGGHIINVLSTSAIQGARGIKDYIIAKHAALGLTRALALEFAPDIHVNAVSPGLTETSMISHFTKERHDLLDSVIPAHRFGKADEIADAVMYLVNSSYVYGHNLIVDGGWMVKNG